MTTSQFSSPPPPETVQVFAALGLQAPRPAMPQLQQQRVFTLEFVDRLKTKHYARQLRKRSIRRSNGGRRSFLRWRRSGRDILPKLPNWDRHSLLIEARRLDEVQDAALHPATNPNVETEPLHFSFSGGGWLMVYMYGVCKALREQKLDENAKFIGTSAGCLSIVSLVLDSDFDAICDSVVNDYVPAAHASWTGPFKMRDYLIDAITRHGNINNIHRLQGKVTVVYTSLSSWVTRRVCHFKNPVHLLHTMVASCCATPLVGLPFEHEGEYVIDGGLLDNQPLFGDGVRTITVTPNVFADADIRPSRYVPPWWSMYPPSQREMKWLYELGYQDALSWCVREGLRPESIIVPTQAAEYEAEWKTVLGQVVGYRWMEDAVLAAAKLFLLSDEAISCSVIRFELLLWKLAAVVTTVLTLGRLTLLWAVVATGLLLALVMLDSHRSIEFVLLLGCHVTLAFVRLANACSHVHSSDHWRLLHEAVVAMEKHATPNKLGFTPQQHKVLTEYSSVYRLSSLLS